MAFVIRTCIWGYNTKLLHEYNPLFVNTWGMWVYMGTEQSEACMWGWGTRSGVMHSHQRKHLMIDLTGISKKFIKQLYLLFILSLIQCTGLCVCVCVCVCQETKSTGEELMPSGCNSQL